MARAGILYSQVAKAASQLAAAGKAPTIDMVREALGDTGRGLFDSCAICDGRLTL